jgi:hypothetical protein
MRFHIASDYIQTFRATLVRGQQHAKSFTDTCASPKENLQVATVTFGFGTLHSLQ